MGSSSRRRQTFSKMTRERAVKEKRALKQEKKQERKAQAALAEGDAVDSVGGDTPADTDAAADES
jgi:hypothetical protein